MKKIFGIFLCLCVSLFLITACNSTGVQEQGGADVPQNAVEDAAQAENAETIHKSEAEAETAEKEARQLIRTYQGESYKLVLTSHDSDNSATATFLNAFAEKVKDISNGYLEVEVHHNGELAGPFDSLEAVTDGDVDIAWGVQSFYDGKFPKTEVIMLPLLDVTSAPQASKALWALWNNTDYLNDEYSDWHVLLLHCNCQTPIIVSESSSVQPETVDDFAGLRCNSFEGPPTLLAEQMNMRWQGVGFSDLHDHMQNGTIDTCLIDWHGVSMLDLLDVSSTIYDENMGTMAYFLLMNKDSYNKLPYELRRVIDTAAAESIEYSSAWDYVQDEAKAQASGEGKLKTFSPDEREKLEAVANIVTQSWVERTDRGQILYDTIVELLEKYK